MNLQNNHGISPLHNAVQKEKVELVRLLVENGADVTLKDKNGQTAEEIALEKYCYNENMKAIADYFKALL